MTLGVFASAVADINRLRKIATVLTKHGFYQFVKGAGLETVLGSRLSPPADTEPVDPSDARGMARRLRLVLEDLGTTFIKFGQILSTRHDLLPSVYINEFEKLQDRVPAMPFDDVEKEIEAGLGAPIATLFKEVVGESLATASIAQVHRATLHSGRAVVVKVQRGGVYTQIRSDLDILYLAAKILEATIEEMSIYSVTDIIKEFERAIVQEVDFVNEARNIGHFRRNFEGDPHIVIPEVIEDRSSTTVLTLEYLDGSKFSELDPSSEQATRLAEILLEATYQQVMVHGLFHSDPHPGNLLVLGPEKLGLVDFGLVGRLSQGQQDDLVALFLTILVGDVDGIARTVLRIGYPQGRISLAEFKREIARMRDQYLSVNLGQIDVGAFVTELMDAAMRFQIKLNSEYSLLAKTTITLDGIFRKTSPDMDLLATAAPYARRLVLQRYNSKRLLENAFTGAMSLSGFLQDVPAQLDQVLMDLESGRVAVNIQNSELDALGHHLTALGTRLSLALGGAAMAVGAAILLAQLDYRPYDVPILLFVALVFISTAGALSWVALAWPYMIPKARRVRLSPILALLRGRKRD